MVEEDSKIYARRMFTGLGYTVTQIPESKEYKKKRADLKAIYKDETIIIEAKSKEPHMGFKELLKETKSEGLATCSRKIIPWSALSSVIREATRQLRATPAPKKAPRVLLISCIHCDWSYVLDAFRYLLYGEVILSLWRYTDTFPDQCGCRPCYYYHFSEFLKYPVLDAVILGGLNGPTLLVNEFGERKTQIQKSLLYSEAKRNNSLYDPEIKRANGKALAIFSKKRLNEKERWQYILDTYGYRTCLMSQYQFNGLVVFDKNQNLE
jgi:hypothetical protein